jgi:hypothetical protein
MTFNFISGLYLIAGFKAEIRTGFIKKGGTVNKNQTNKSSVNANRTYIRR